MKIAVSLGLWQDRPPTEVLRTAAIAEAEGFAELWIGEMATYDVFALATAVAGVTERIPLVLGPLAVTVRDPMMIAMGVASVASLTGRSVGVALGTSSTVVVEQWHGRSRAQSTRALAESATAVRSLLAGEKAQVDGEVVRTIGFRLRTPAHAGPLTIAAFGPASVRVAAAHADRMVLNLISPDRAAELIAAVNTAAAAIGRPAPRIALWVPAAVDPTEAAWTQLRTTLVGYLAAPGYGEMFTRDGFGELVRLARSGAHPRDVLAAIGADLPAAIGLAGDRETVAARMAAYQAAGVDELVVVPASTVDDEAGAGTLKAVSDLRSALPTR
ncbi:LLM class F420-dependent oxidoreductase [Fodinicola acaciae]|uniref:LLM class F420-dependent oxidoreductase n=1 Tax=Fodinicola acaciae TaxID=2681555 RepID=UPI0013CFD04D|nr:LLM class F420-dependent oxidoreductase [Fodinicola acaciae]